MMIYNSKASDENTIDEIIKESGAPKRTFKGVRKKLSRDFYYQERMLKESYNKNNFEPFQLRRKMQEMLTKYGYREAQWKFLLVLMDEIIYPIFDDSNGNDVEITVRLICSETTQNHVVLVAAKGIEKDPLGEESLDPLRREILEGKCVGLFSSVIDGGYEICVQL